MDTTVTFMESPATAGVLHIIDGVRGTLCGEANTDMGGEIVSIIDPAQHRVCWTCAHTNLSHGRQQLPEWMRQKHLTESIEETLRILNSNEVVEGAPRTRLLSTTIRVQQYLSMLPHSGNGYQPPAFESSVVVGDGAGVPSVTH